jgi:poly(glycerol-phosphate) alpha-glucosyltransferase
VKTCTLTASVSRQAGGLFHSVRSLSRELALLPEMSVAVSGLQDQFSVADAAAWLPLQPQVHPVTGPRAFGYAPELKHSIKHGEYDLLHVHGLWQYPSVASRQWHRQTGRPYLISPRGMLDPWALRNSHWKKRIAGWLFENAHLRGAACLHALNESEAQSMRAYGLTNPIAIIPNGIDLPECRMQNAECRSAPWQDFVDPDRKVLLFLSRIHPKKGLPNLLRAWATCHSSPITRHSEWILAIAGWDQGGHEAELKQLCDELNIPWADVREQKSEIGNRKSEIIFLGPQFKENKAACYADCDAFVLPSFSEGLPMAVLEAWAYGKPVLMTPECNLPEGFAANAAIRIETNPESIAQGLSELSRAASACPLRHDRGEGQGEVSNSPAGPQTQASGLRSTPGSELQAMGANGRALVAAKFTWPKIAAEMKSVYDWVLCGGIKPECVILK